MVETPDKKTEKETKEAPARPSAPQKSTAVRSEDLDSGGRARVSRYADPRARAGKLAGGPRGKKGPGGPGGRRGGGRKGGRERSEYAHKIIDIRRVTRVVAGGRRFSFSVSLVAGDRRGSVGVGVGKASDTALAIEKAERNAKKNMITPRLTEDHSIPHEIQMKYGATVLRLAPAPGKGIVAGSSVRTVLELAGVKDISAKLFSRSKNKLNNARAAVEALRRFGVVKRAPEQKAEGAPQKENKEAPKKTQMANK